MKPINYKDHKQLHNLLFAILTLCLSIWFFVFTLNYVNNKQIAEITSPPDPNVLTDEQRQQAITELKEAAAKSPPLTDTRRMKAIAELKKAVANQNK